MQKYTEIRGKIESGDVVFFKPKQAFGWGRLVTWWTKSQYSHVGMAIVDYGRVWLLEASIKSGVRLIPLSKKKNFTLVATSLDFSLIKDEACLKVGQPYDWLGALKAALNLPNQNNRFYCSELVGGLLFKAGHEKLENPASTPASLFNYFEEYQQFVPIEVKGI